MRDVVNHISPMKCTLRFLLWFINSFISVIILQFLKYKILLVVDIEAAYKTIYLPREIIGKISDWPEPTKLLCWPSEPKLGVNPCLWALTWRCAKITTDVLYYLFTCHPHTQIDSFWVGLAIFHISNFVLWCYQTYFMGLTIRGYLHWQLNNFEFVNKGDTEQMSLINLFTTFFSARERRAAVRYCLESCFM